MGSCCVAGASIELMGSGDSPTSVFRVAGTADVGTMPGFLFPEHRVTPGVPAAASSALWPHA
jgi:hypothetical protein